MTNVFTTKLCLSQQKYVCCNKNVFVVTKDIFVATILQLWPLQPMVDTTLSAVREPMATCVVHPASCCMLLVMTVTIYFIYPRGKFIPANPFLNHHCPGSLSVQTWCSCSWTTIALVLSQCKHDVPVPKPPLPWFSLSANMMFLFLNHHCPGSLSVQTWCSYSWTTIAQVLSQCKHDVPIPEPPLPRFSLSANMMFLNHHCPGSLSVQTWCSYSWTTIARVLSQCKHDVPIPEPPLPGFCVHTWCSTSETECTWFFLSTNMMFPFQRSNGICSLWAQTPCSTSRDWMHLCKKWGILGKEAWVQPLWHVLQCLQLVIPGAEALQTSIYT